jgi:hypothetical protein
VRRLGGAGLHVGQALASVLLYRLVSLWLVAAAGWVVLLGLRHRRNIDAGSAAAGSSATPAVTEPSAAA